MNISIDIKIKLILSKGRNIVYYRSIDDRPRCQYFHVLREYREELVELRNQIKPREELNLINELIQVIPKKLKTTDCINIISDISKVFYNHDNK